MKMSVNEFIEQITMGNVERVKNTIVECALLGYFCSGEMIYNYFMASDNFDDIYVQNKVSSVIEFIVGIND